MTASRRFIAIACAAIGVVLSQLIGGCAPAAGDPSTTGTGGAGTITLTASTTALTIPRGGSAQVALSLKRNAFNHDVTLSASGTYTGITATFSPTILTGDAGSSTLNVSVATDAPLFPQTLLVLATTVGTDGQTVPITITAIAPTLSVTRNGTGTGTVVSNPAGISCGGTCSAPFYIGAQVTLTATAPAGSAFAGWSGACTGTAATCTATVAQASTSNNVTATFNSTAPSFSLAITPASANVPQGASATAGVKITRANGFSGPVNLAISGAPSGATVTATPTSVTGDSATINVTVPLSVAVGNYPITVTATGSGVSQQTATFGVVVTSAPGGNSNVTFGFASCDSSQVPIWFAAQSGSGPWTRVTAGAGNTFTFSVGTSGGIAYVIQTGLAYQTFVQYASGAEFAAIASGPGVCNMTEQTGTRHLTGTVTNTGTQGAAFWSIALGGLYDSHQPSDGPSYALTSVATGQRDLIAARVAVNGAFTAAQRMILRRATAYPNNGVIPALDFNGGESFSVSPILVTVNNLGTDTTNVGAALVTPRGRSAPFYVSPGPTPSTQANVNRYFAIPSDQVQADEFHLVSVFATLSTAGKPPAFRYLQTLLKNPANQTITLGPAINTPTVTSLSTSSPVRLRARLASQVEYKDAVEGQYRQSDRGLTISSTAAYAAGTPATWTLDIPDLSSAAYDPTWGLQAGKTVDWTVVARGGNLLPFQGAPLVDNAQLIGAGIAGSGTSTGQSVRSRPTTRP